MNEKLLTTLKRFRRRHLIEEELESQQSLSAIKESVRSEENNSETEQLFNEILTKESILHPESAQIATELQAHLEKKFPDYEIAIILIGSATTGGQRIRKLFLGESESGAEDEDKNHTPDFDFILGINHKNSYPGEPSIEQGVFDTIDAVTADFLSSKGTAICEHYRPGNFAISGLNEQTDVREQSEFITNRVGHDYSLHSVYSLFFTPSFPPEFNEKNRRIYLDFLKDLYIKEPDSWNDIVSDLFEEWRNINKLKKKYFSKQSIKRSNFDKTAEQFSEVRLKILKDLIKTTADENGQVYIDFL